MGGSNLIQGRIIDKKDPSYVGVEIEGMDVELICRAHDAQVTREMPVMVSFRPDSTDIEPRDPENPYPTHRRTSTDCPPG